MKFYFSHSQLALK